jgi:hypothetical protein
MSQVIDLCEDSGDDDGEWPNTASVPSLPLFGKRPRDKEESFDDAHLRNENGPGNKNATGSAAFVIEQLANEVDVSLHKKRRGVVRSEASVKNDAAGLCMHILKGVHATEQDVSEHSHVTDHRESHASIAAASSHPMNSDSEQTSGNDGSTNTNSQKLLTLKPLSNSSGVSVWENRLNELAEFRKIHGHCNVPQKSSAKLGNWVDNQRSQYRLHRDGKMSSITLSRIQELESLGFKWDRYFAAWQDRLSELADYCKEHGHCNVPKGYSKNTKLATWVSRQRCNYRFYQEGKISSMTPFRLQKLESMGFDWGVCATPWENRLSELTDFRKKHGHCNATKMNSENTKLANWVAYQRCQYKAKLKGKKSHMTLSRIQELESLGFDWRVCATPWEDHLSELADFRKKHGHCNVPQNWGEKNKLGGWVNAQRSHYKFHLEGKRSQMTLPRIQALESLGFEWKTSRWGKETRKQPSLDDYTRCAHRKPANSRQGASSQLDTATSNVILRATGYY